MKEWMGVYSQYQEDGIGPSEISRLTETGLSTVNARLKSGVYQEYLEERRIEEDRKSEMSPGERMGGVLEKVMSSLERQIELAAGDDEKVLALIPRVVELGKLVPPMKTKTGPLDVVEVAAVDPNFPVEDVEDVREEASQAPEGVLFDDSDGKFANSGEEVEWEPEEFDDLEGEI